MTKANFRFSAFLSTMLVILMFAFPLTSTAQIWDAIGVTKKPKDYNKPPDKKEFQLPINGEYKANPTFFAAHTDDERCQAIDLWLSSIRYEASQSNQIRYERSNEEIDMERVNSQQIQRFATVFFRNIFGKSLPELSEKEQEKVAKSLNKCSYQYWVLGHLENPFRNPLQMRDWAANFDEVEQSINKEKLEAQKRLYRERFQKEAREKGYNVAELLKETDLYSLHAAFLSDGHADWCSPSERQAVVGLIFNIDEKSPIENDDEYWQSFESEMLPVIRSSCSNAEKIYILNYVDGFYINYNRNQVESTVNPSYPSDVINIGVYSANQSGTSQRGWINGDTMSNLTGSTSRRTQRIITFKNLSENQTSNAKLATISGLREVLKIRKEKSDAEAKIKREKTAEEEKIRQSEAQRQAEINRQNAIAQKRVRYRARASKILNLYKKGAVSNYNFSSYTQQEALQNIYSGDFEQFTGGYSSEDSDEIVKYYSSILFSGNFKAISEQVALLKKIARLRLPVRIAYFAYHETYEEQCRQNPELEWKGVSYQSVTVEKLGTTVINEIKGPVSVFWVRSPFMETFDKTYNTVQDGLYVQLMTGVSSSLRQEYQIDFRKFLKAEGCSSPTVRHFEVNLYLATEWLLPLQELLAPESLQNQTIQVEKPKPQAEIQKPKPVIEKPKVNTRRKN